MRACILVELSFFFGGGGDCVIALSASSYHCLPAGVCLRCARYCGYTMQDRFRGSIEVEQEGAGVGIVDRQLSPKSLSRGAHNRQPNPNLTQSLYAFALCLVAGQFALALVTFGC